MATLASMFQRASWSVCAWRWRSLPGQLARENKKFVYGVVRASARARDFEESLQWLRDYGVVYRVPRVSTLRFPLSGYESVSGFKLFCVDEGLLGALGKH